jgi:hypothetical protein
MCLDISNVNTNYANKSFREQLATPNFLQIFNTRIQSKLIIQNNEQHLCTFLATLN